MTSIFEISPGSGREGTLGTTLRRMRKYAKISQAELGKLISVHQTAISRIESNEQSLAPEQLRVISKFFGVSLDDLMLNRINYWDIAKRFGQPPPFADRYRQLPFSRVRELLPLLFFLNQEKGHDFTQKLLSEYEMESFLFLNPDQPIGVNCYLDLLRHSLNRKLLSESNFNELINQTRLESVHGFLHAIYVEQTSPLSLVQSRILNSHLYEKNFKHEIQTLTQNRMEIFVAPEHHMKGVDYKDRILGDFLCRYKKSYLQQFPKYIGESPIELIEKDCHFTGTAPKCVYELRVA
ncbi:MAG: helix-turn-helix transcriptional regulator [Bdellovibrionota bacterium]